MAPQLGHFRRTTSPQGGTMKLFYSEEALADLIQLRAFIERHNPAAAECVAQELIERLENIRRFPEMGRPVALAPDPNTIRDVVFGDYIVRYSVHTETVVILRIWHHYENRV